MMDDKNTQIDVHTEIGGKCTFTATAIHTGNGHIYCIDGKLEEISEAETKKWCAEVKTLLEKNVKKMPVSFFNTSQQIGLKTRSFNKLRSPVLHNRSDISTVLYKELVNDVQIQDLFTKSKEFAEKHRQSNEYHQSNIIGLVGPARVGKTTLVRQIIEHIKNDFDYIFYIDLKERSYNQKTDLLRFLMPPSLPWMTDKRKTIAVLETIIKQPERIFLILDDIDSEKLLEAIDDFSAISYFETDHQSSSKFILNILKGNIFSESQKLIVSRCFELDRLPADYKPAFVVDVVGLTPEMQNHLCRSQGHCMEEIFNKLTLLPDIHTLCAKPLNCKVFLDFCRDEKNCLTYTNVFLSVFYRFFCTVPQNRFCLEKLADFAWSRFVESKGLADIYLFNMDVLENSNLDKSYFNFFFGTYFCKHPISFFTDHIEKYHFFCLFLHDFFAAMKLQSLESIDVEDFLSASFENLANHSENSHYFVIIVFLFGFCNLPPFLNDEFIQETFSDSKKQMVKNELDKFVKRLEARSNSHNSNVDDCISIWRKERD